MKRRQMAHKRVKTRITTKSQTTRAIYLLITFACLNEMSTNVFARNNNIWRTKEKTSDIQMNICDLKDRYFKFYCSCGKSTEPRNATKAECWVYNGIIPPEDRTWQSFQSQPTLQTLIFSVRADGALVYVPTKALKYLKSLKSITITYGKIDDLTSFVFANLTTLRELDLFNNQIQTLQPYSFAHLPSLTTINLEGNIITDIDENAFVELPELQKLVFTRNNISMVKDGTFQYTFKLQELYLDVNNIYHLNRKTFNGLANLKKLDLTNNRLQYLNNLTFADLWNLEELLLGKNDLRCISTRSFDGMSQLKILSLDENKLSSLPSALFEYVRRLKYLNLSSNELQVLTIDDIKPIIGNLKSRRSSLEIQDNNFVCNCRLKWIHRLRIRTTSINTKNSLDRVTCRMYHPITSSLYNKVSCAFNDSKLDYNKHILQVGLVRDKMNITDKNILTRNLTKGNNSIVSNKKSVKRKFLRIPPDTLPCPRIVSKTTEMPSYKVDSVTPIGNDIKTCRYQEINSANIKIKSSLLVLWCIVVHF